MQVAPQPKAARLWEGRLVRKEGRVPGAEDAEGVLSARLAHRGVTFVSQVTFGDV